MSNLLYGALVVVYVGVLLGARPGLRAFGKCLIPLQYALGAIAAIVLVGYLTYVFGPLQI